MGSHIASVHADVQTDPEAAVPADEPEDTEIVAKVDHWRVIWYLTFAAFGGILLAAIIKGFIENGDIEVRVVVVLVTCRPAKQPPSTSSVV